MPIATLFSELAGFNENRFTTQKIIKIMAVICKTTLNILLNIFKLIKSTLTCTEKTFHVPTFKHFMGLKSRVHQIRIPSRGKLNI